MIIPIGTNNRLQRRPTANYVLLGLNILIFIIPIFLQAIDNRSGISPGGTESLAMSVERKLNSLKLHSTEPRLYEFITYAFLHANIMHILGNMLFLLIFGNNVNDRLGHTGYVLLYLGGAIFSGIGHVLFNVEPVVGASGAVAAVTGAYMVLFPKTNIHIFWFFILITTFEIPALYFILFKLIIYDNLIMPSMSGPTNVAYGAHLAGYLFGVVVPMLLIMIKLIPHSQFDLWALTKRWHRRQQYNTAVHSGYDPFGHSEPKKKTVFSKVKNSGNSAQEQQITDMRGKIGVCLQQGNYNEASRLYVELMQIDSKQVLAEQNQLDVANKLMQDQYHVDAAQAYELFLESYPRYPFIEQIQLMLGLLYSRYLESPKQARENLEKAMDKLRDPGQRQMCQEELNKL